MNHVYRFGAKPPHLNRDEVCRQLHAAHRYQNALIEIERSRRVAWREKLHQLAPTLMALEKQKADADAAIDAMLATIGKANSEAHRKRATPEEKAKLDALKLSRKTIAQAYKTERLRVIGEKVKAEKPEGRVRKRAKDAPPPEWNGGDENIRTALAAVDTNANEKRKLSRATCGCFWGTYLCIEDAVRAAISKSVGEGPRFQRWTGDGKIAVQFQGGQSFGDLCGGINSCVISIDYASRRGDGTCRAEVKLRIGSNTDRSPIWTTAKFWYHEEIPPETQIKWAFLTRNVRGTNEEWSVQFLADSAPPRRTRTLLAGGLTVAVNVGWRVVRDGLRVAMIVAEGVKEELILPEYELSAFDKASHIRAVRDDSLAAMLLVLNAWRKSEWGQLENEAVEKMAGESTNRAALEKNERMRDIYGSNRDAWASFSANRLAPALPDWFVERTKEAGKWKGPAQIAGLLSQWRDNRFPGDERILSAMSAWVARDRHLWSYERGLGYRAVARREEKYRIFVANLRKRFGRILLADTDYASMKKRSGVTGPSENETARRNSQRCAPGSLAEMLRRSGAEEMPAMELTMRCHLCGELSGERNKANLYHTCAHCAATCDQDEGHCRNLLASANVSSGGRGHARVPLPEAI